MKLTSNAGESERDFRVRVLQASRETRDAAVQKLRDRYASKVARLTQRVQSAADAVTREEQQASAQKTQTFRNLGIASRDHAAFAGGDVLVSEKAEAAGRSPGPAAAPSEGRAGSVSGVFEEQEGVSAREQSELVHVCGNARIMHRKNRPGAGCDLSCGVCWIHRRVLKAADIDEYRRGATVDHCR